MEICFTKVDESTHDIVVRGRKGPDVALTGQPTRGRLPHDLVHAAVEAALGFDDGFWAAIAAGATFDGFRRVERNRHEGSGSKVMRKLGDAVMRRELQVNWCYARWSGRPMDPRAVGPAPVDEAQVQRAARALDEASARWAAVPVGGTLDWSW